MLDPYDDEEHMTTDEYVREYGYPKHGPHRAGAPGGNCNIFPGQTYHLEGWALCGTERLEVVGPYGFMHVRCPWADTKPCTCGRHSLHLDSLVVAVDGACPGNGTQRATRSACGVFFGPGSHENRAFRVRDVPGSPHTSQRAELTAAIEAVEASFPYIYDGGQWDCRGCPTPCAITHLVIKSDSAYLVNGMTAHLDKWRANGWRTAKGTEVKNQDLWTRLDDLTQLLHDETGVAIDFWHVPRDQNKDADNLANQGLTRELLIDAEY